MKNTNPIFEGMPKRFFNYLDKKNLKRYQIALVTLSLFFFGCNECEKRLKQLDMPKKLDEQCGEFHVYRNSNILQTIKEETKIKFKDYGSDYGDLNLAEYIHRDGFDSLSYTYNSFGLSIEYFRLASCRDFIPVIEENGEEISLKCVTISLGEYNCREGEIVFETYAEGCKNVIRHYVSIDYERIQGKDIKFKPYKNIEFKLRMDSSIVELHNQADSLEI